MAKTPTPKAAGTKPAATPSAADIAAAQAEADRASAKQDAADKVVNDQSETDRIAAENAIQAAIAGGLADGVLAAIADRQADGLDADEAELGGFDMSGRTIFVRSVSPRGRRRAGFAFGPVPVPIAVDDLTEAQLVAILGDVDHLVLALNAEGANR